MNTTRKYRYLQLGDHVSSQSPEVTKRFLSHLGKDVQFLDISSDDAMKLLEDPDSLLMFAQLKKLTVSRLSELTKFEKFPESLEHVHVQQLSIVENTKDIVPLCKIKNLVFLTADSVQVKAELNVLVRMAAQPCTCTINPTIFNLDESLKILLESLTYLEHIQLKLRSNFIRNPTVTIEDVTGIQLKREPHTFVKFAEFHNLQWINISCLHNGFRPSCFSFHQKVLCQKVEELEIDFGNNNTCLGCFRSFIDSCPNLKKVVFSHVCLEHVYIKHICYKLPQLNHLEINDLELERVSSTFSNLILLLKSLN